MSKNTTPAYERDCLIRKTVCDEIPRALCRSALENHFIHYTSLFRYSIYLRIMKMSDIKMKRMPCRVVSCVNLCSASFHVTCAGLYVTSSVSCDWIGSSDDVICFLCSCLLMFGVSFMLAILVYCRNYL